MNEWLTPVVEAYTKYFGKTAHPVVWDVGSRDGDDGVELAKRIYNSQPNWFWKNATVVCMEPNPEQSEVIRKRHKNVKVLRLAASNKSKKAKFMVYHGDEGAVGSSSLDLLWKDGDLEGHIITVRTVRLDQLITDEQIDIMKIDCEGHSVEVLEGLGDRLKNVKVFHIETEKWTDSNIKVKAYMLAHGFMLVDETEQYGGMPDQVWVRH